MRQSSTRKQWGGARDGSGRRLKYGEPMRVVNLRFPETLWREIESAAEAEGITRSEYIVLALRDALRGNSQ